MTELGWEDRHLFVPGALYRSTLFAAEFIGTDPDNPEVLLVKPLGGLGAWLRMGADPHTAELLDELAPPVPYTEDDSRRGIRWTLIDTTVEG